MGRLLTVEKENSKGVTRIKVLGEITEDADFGTLGALEKQVVIDLGGIRRINSCGVREWVDFLKVLPQQSEITYERCPPPMMLQVNTVAHFLGDGKLTNFIAPYFCPKCSTGVDIVLDTHKDFPDRQPNVPPRNCPTCSTELLFDDIAESYFAFLKDGSGL